MIDFIQHIAQWFLSIDWTLHGGQIATFLPFIPFIPMTIAAGQTITADDFVSSSSGASDSGKVAKLNASGQIPNAFLENKYSSGSFSRTMSTSAAETVAHGLGVTPKYIRVRVIAPVATTNWQGNAESEGSYNGTNEACVWRYDAVQNTGTTNVAVGARGNNTGKIAEVITDHSLGGPATADATFDSTNITLTWTASNATGTGYVFWEAFA